MEKRLRLDLTTEIDRYKYLGIMKSMKLSSRSIYLRIVAVVMALSFSLYAHAESPREEVVHAFHLLKKADHDYAGHRAKAMGEVEAAGRDLGLDLKGDLDDHERQWKSDDQLIEARRLLREARNKLEREDRDRVAGHLDGAIAQIDAALNVK
jgi:hypothetical protein